MPNPYGSDVPSPIARPAPQGREIVPAPSLPPEYPAYLRPIPVNTRDIHAALRGYLNQAEPKVVRWLYSTWNAEREAITYQEIRNALRDGEIQPEWLARWQQDYSRFVVEVLELQWRQAMEAGARLQGEGLAQLAGRPVKLDPQAQRIRDWIAYRGAELAVNLTDMQVEAVRAILRHHIIMEPIGSEELARRLRAVLGLTPKEEQAVRRFRQALLAEGLPPDKVEHQVQHYVGFLHRRRALRIARTEHAFAWNFGALEVMRQAQESGLIRRALKEFSTADDERVCSICGPLDGQVIELDETFPGGTRRLPNVYVPPLHPQCRCVTLFRVEVVTSAMSQAA